jgi:hypothetical protein
MLLFERRRLRRLEALGTINEGFETALKRFLSPNRIGRGILSKLTLI